MAAAPFKVSMKVINSAGQSKNIYLTGSDVNAAALVFQIADLILGPAYGTDTTNMTIFINGVDSTGMRIINSANQGGTFSRQIMSSPVTIPAGALVKIVQNSYDYSFLFFFI